MRRAIGGSRRKRTGTTGSQSSLARAGSTKLRRGEIYWADFSPPRDRRPVLILTRSQGIRYLTSIVVAPITSTIHSTPSELPLGPEEGLNRRCVANCDNVQSIEKAQIDERRVGSISLRKVRALDAALRFALQIR